MAEQEVYKICRLTDEEGSENWVELRPDGGLKHSFETTYTEDSKRVQTGEGHFTPLFTVESFGYKRSGVGLEDMASILQLVGSGHNFKFHYFSPFYGQWRNDEFYVGKGSLVIGQLCLDDEEFDTLEFNIIGVNPVYSSGEVTA